MSTELNEKIVWTFQFPCDVPNDVSNILVAGEEAKYAYKTFRDIAIFTNKRLIVRDAQGITGSKVEVYSLPYSSILMWSSENKGKLFDVNAEIELWTKAGHIKIKIGKNADIRNIDRVLAECIL